MKKFGIGVYATLLSGVLALAAGLYFITTDGKFGAVQRNTFSPVIVGLLAAALVVAVLLILIRKPGLASAAVTTLSGVAILVFAHKCYWYVTDVFVAIDEKGFDPRFLIFAGLALAAFIIGEIAIYLPKWKKAKAA